MLCIDCAPSLGVYYFLSLNLSVCLSVCLSRSFKSIHFKYQFAVSAGLLCAIFSIEVALMLNSCLCLSLDPINNILQIPLADSYKFLPDFASSSVILECFVLFYCIAQWFSDC